jgi:formyl-CoA transferase
VTKLYADPAQIVDLLVRPDRLDVVDVLVEDALSMAASQGSADIQCRLTQQHPYVATLRGHGVPQRWSEPQRALHRWDLHRKAVRLPCGAGRGGAHHLQRFGFHLAAPRRYPRPSRLLWLLRCRHEPPRLDGGGWRRGTTMADQPSRNTALQGLRVLDMTQYEAGTSCTQALAWLGADVVKVEPPGFGDPGRGGARGEGNAPYFINWNSNKRSIVLDLKRPEGQQILLDMAPHYDVFVENYGPGVVERLDIGYKTMKQANPRIIYAQLKGFGTSGPYSDYKCFDMVAQATAGAFSVTGEADGPPMRPGATVGDSGTGVQLALAITAAYVQQLQTGEGQHIEISMQEAMTYYMRTQIAIGGDWGNAVAPRNGNGTAATTNLYPCAPAEPASANEEPGPNDYVFVMCSQVHMWEAMARAIGRPDLVDDPRFHEDAPRLANAAELYKIVAEWTRTRTKHEAMTILGEAGVPVGKNFDTRDLFTDKHLNERGFVKTLDHPEHGEIRVLGFAPRMSGSEVPIQRAPLMGEHSEEILASDLGLEATRLEELRITGVIS